MFDPTGNPIANGTIVGMSGTQGLAVSEYNELFATTGGDATIHRFLIEETGEAVANGSFDVPGATQIAFLGFGDGNQLYAADFGSNVIFRCIFAADGAPSSTSILSVTNPVDVAVVDDNLFVSNRTEIAHFVVSGNGDVVLHDVIDTSDIAGSVGSIAVLPASLDCDLNDIPDECEANSDEDFVIDTCDNCVDVSNPSQADFDDDGLGDACDADIDNDGVENELDVCDFTFVGAAVDSEGRSLGDIDLDCDTDLDDMRLLQTGFTGPAQ